MRILIVMLGFFPGKKYGGPPVSVDNFCSLMKEHECFIVTRNHDLFDSEEYKSIDSGWNHRDNCVVKYLSDAEFKKPEFKRVFDEIKPDVIYLQGLFESCVFPCLQIAKKNKTPVLLAPRGQLCSGAINLKKYKKVPYIYALRLLGLVKSVHWQSTSEEESDAILKWMKINQSAIHRLDNVPSIPKKVYSRQKKNTGEGEFVFLSRIHPKKNLLSAIRYFQEVEGEVSFDIYGSIEDKDYWEQCMKETKRLPKNVNVQYKGLVDHENVHEVFSKYDAFVFPTLSENYGHVIAESLLVGTPVIISDQTPWSDVNDNNAGWAIELSDEAQFVRSINAIVNMDEKEMSVKRASSREYAFEKCHGDSLKSDYNRALEDLIR